MTTPKITKPADLKGKKVGVGRYGSVTADAIERHCAVPVVPDKDVIIVQIGGEKTRGATLPRKSMGLCLWGQQGHRRSAGLSRYDRFEPAADLLPSQWDDRRDIFYRRNPELAKDFLKSWVEGIKTFKTDKETSLRVLAKYLKINDRNILEKSYEIYRPVYKRVPYGDSKAVKFALDQMLKDLPNVRKLGRK